MWTPTVPTLKTPTVTTLLSAGGGVWLLWLVVVCCGLLWLLLWRSSCGCPVLLVRVVVGCG